MEIPCSPTDGVSIEALEKALRQRKVKACLCVTNVHNPLGCNMPDERKAQLVRLLAKHRVPLIEDDIYGDLAYGPSRPAVCKALDREGLVMLCSSFSKTLAPGARVGWCAPGRFFDDVLRLKLCTTIATPTLPQMMIAEFLATGGYQHHLRKTRLAYAHQVQMMSAAVQRYFPAGTRVTRPVGGHVVWVEMPERVDAMKLYERAAERKISVAPGPIFSARGKFRNCLRLNCSAAWTDTIERAVATLGDLAKDPA
jgi:DNA-binding transcriptional MocR family regulator